MLILLTLTLFSKMVNKAEGGQNVQKTLHLVYVLPLNTPWLEVVMLEAYINIFGRGSIIWSCMKCDIFTNSVDISKVEFIGIKISKFQAPFLSRDMHKVHEVKYSLI